LAHVLWPNGRASRASAEHLYICYAPITKVGIGPGHIVLDGDPAPPAKMAQP